MKHLLLDRDGCLNRHSDSSYYITSADDITYFDDVKDFIVNMLDHTVRLSVVTNQQAIGLTLLSEDELIKMHEKLLREVGIQQDDLPLYYCPHLADTCDCRKPLPGLLERAISDAKTNKADVVMIGDKESDYQAAQACGVAFIQLSRPEYQVPTFVGPGRLAADLQGCANILSNEFGWELT